MSLKLKYCSRLLMLLCFCILCVPRAHAFFLQEPEEAVKNISLRDLAELYTRPAYAIDQTTENLRQKSLDENAISLKEKTGVDTRDSFFEILKKHNGVKNIIITVKDNYEDVKTNSTDIEVVNISFEYSDACISMYCITTKRNILKMQSASFIMIHKVDILKNKTIIKTIPGSEALDLIVNIYVTSRQ